MRERDEKLLPCPFCGKTERVGIESQMINEGMHSIGCLNCKLSFWGTKDKSELVKKWNTRYELGRKSRGVDWNDINSEIERNKKLDAIGSEGGKVTLEESQQMNGDLP